MTGGASGIGKAIAERLDDDGARVVIADLDVPAGQAVAHQLRDATFVAADVTEANDRDAIVASALADTGRIDNLVNNAGVQHVAPLHEFPPERWHYLLELHLFAPAMLTRAVLPHMYQRGSGRITSQASIPS